MAGDALFKSVVLLLNGNGPNGSTDIVDASPSAHAVGLFGAVQISTAQAMFGGSSLLFGGGDRVQIPDSADWDFGTGDFSIEIALRFSAIYDTTTLLGNYPGWVVQYRPDSGGFVFGVNNDKLKIAPFSPVLNTWYRLGIRRVSGAMSIFVDEAPIGSPSAVSTDISGSVAPLLIGELYAGGYIQQFHGHMAHIRITREARDLDSQPTAPWPDYATQFQGVVRDSADLPCSRRVRAYRRDTGVLVGSAVSDAESGIYTLNSTHVGAHTLNFLPNDGEALNALVLDNVYGV